MWSACIVGAGDCGSHLCRTAVLTSEPAAWGPPGRRSLEGMREIKNKPKPTSMRFEPMNTDWNPCQLLLPLPLVVWVPCRSRSSLSQSLTLTLGSGVRRWRKIQGKMGQLLPHINEENPQINNKVWELQNGWSSLDLLHKPSAACPNWRHTGKGILAKLTQSKSPYPSYLYPASQKQEGNEEKLALFHLRTLHQRNS